MGECTLDLSSCVVVAALAVVLHFWRDGLRQCRSAVGPDSIGPILVLLEALEVLVVQVVLVELEALEVNIVVFNAAHLRILKQNFKISFCTSILVVIWCSHILTIAVIFQSNKLCC